jgi:Tol biopolymer transport system component
LPLAGLEPQRSYDTNSFAISPDGRNFCFVANDGGGNALFVRPLDSFEARRLEGSEGAAGPFWSSDGEWIAFSAHGKLWKVRLSGNVAPLALCDAPPPGTVGSWRGNTILLAGPREGVGRVLRVSDAGGTPVAVTTLLQDEWRHSWPWLLPDDEHFLFVSMAAHSLDHKLILGSLVSPKRSVLLSDVSQARLAGKDELIFVRDSKLMRQRFDLAKGTMVGDPELIANDVSYFHPTSRADFDVSQSGTIVYRTDTSRGKLVLLDRKGAETKLIDDKVIAYDHALSPDGRKAAVSVIDRPTGLLDIWIYDLGRSVHDRFSTPHSISYAPVWSPDGHSIVYSESLGGVFPHIVRRSLSAATSEDLVPRGPFLEARSFTSDGQTLFYEHSSAATRTDIYRLSMSTKTSTPFLQTSFSEGNPRTSPEGNWLAFESNATGNSEVYVQSLAEGTERIRISTTGGQDPRWRRGGRELFFISPAGGIISATQRSPGRWDDPVLTELFHLPAKLSAFSASPDGQSFLVSYTTPGPGDSLFHVVVR